MTPADGLAELTWRLQRLEDIEALRRLKAQYARYCDPQHDVAGIVALFTEDAVFDIGEEYGVYQGKSEIRRFLEGATDIIPWAIHYMIAPIIDVADDRRTAHGSWYLWQLANMPDEAGGHQAVWIAGVYHDDFRRDEGEWRLSKVVLRMQIMSPYRDGWAKTPWIGK
jgi:hypothetical protein